MKKTISMNVYAITACAIMAALVCISTLVRIPLLGSKIQVANTVCLLSGFLLGPVFGGVASGLGALLNDILFEGNDFIQTALSFLTKYAMASIAGYIAYYREDYSHSLSNRRAICASAIGSIAYIAMHSGKHFLLQYIIAGVPLDATWLVILSKLPATVLNGIIAALLAPVVYKALFPAWRQLNISSKIWDDVIPRIARTETRRIAPNM